MNLRTDSKRVLAVAMSLTLLLSCMVWSGVSAAASTVSTDFTGYTVTATTDTANYNNAAYAAVVDSGDAAYGAAMRLTYTDNSIDKEDVGFRFFSGTGTSHQWSNNTTFLVEFDYKVEAVTAAAQLRVLAGSKSWASNKWNSAQTAGASYWGVAKELAVTATAGEWQTARIVLSGCSYQNRNAIHIYLHSDAPQSQGGTSVLIDNVRVTSGYVPASVTFDYGYDSKTQTVMGVVGSPVTLPTPTRAGYVFEGWNTAADGSGTAVTAATFGGNVTYYAVWKQDVPTLGTMVQDFEGATDIGDFATNTQKPFELATDTSAGSGTKALKVTLKKNYNGNFARPLWAFRMNGQPSALTVTPGAPLTVTFKLKATRDTAYIGYMLDTVNDLSVLTVNPTTSKKADAYRTMQVLSSTSHGTLNAASNEVQNIALTAGEWVTITAEIPSVVSHGSGDQYLVLAVTDTKSTSSNGSWVDYDLYVDDVTVSTLTGGGTVNVTYNTMGGDPLEPGTGTVGMAVTATATKENYTFDGWYAEEACQTPVTVFPAQADVTLYAGWRAADAKVMTFEVEDGYVPTVYADMDLSDSGVKDYYLSNPNNWHIGSVAPCEFVDMGGKTVLKMSCGTGSDLTTQAYGLRLVGKDSVTNGFSVTKGTIYSVRFKYKVEAMPTPTEIAVIEGSVPWTKGNPNSGAVTHSGFTVTAADVSDTWQEGQIVFRAATVSKGVHLVMRATDMTQRVGTAVYFSDIKIQSYILDDFTLTDGATRVEGEQNVTPDGEAAIKVDTATTGRVTYAEDMGDCRFATNTINNAVVWLYTAADTDVTLSAYNGQTVVGEQAVSLMGGRWNRVEMEFGFAAVAGEESGFIALGVTAASGATVYMDDISVGTYPNDSTKVQGYERFVPAKTGTNTARLDGSIHGLNGSTVVSGKGYNSNQSLQIAMQSDVEADVSRTVLIPDKMDATATVGGGYIITFYAMVEEDLQVTFALGTTATVDLSDRGENATAAEVGATRTVHLQAGQWTPVSVDVAELQGKYPETVLNPYVTLAAWFEGAAANNAKCVYVDDVCLRDYVAPTPVREDTMCFEDTYAFGFGKSLYSSAVGTVTVTMDRNSSAGGYYALKVNTNTVGGGVRPQFNLTESNGTAVRVEKGKDYRISFKAYLPQEAPGSTLRYWLAVTDTDTPFTNTAEKDAAAVYESNGSAVTKGAWTQIVVVVEDLPADGYLRLGICGERMADTTFWLDDIRVTEYRTVEHTGTETVWDFETYRADDKDFIRYGTGYVTDEQNHTDKGLNALRLDGQNTSGFDRNQFILINPATKQPYEFVKGDSYTLRFWMYWTDEVAKSFTMNAWIWGTDDPAEVFTTRAEKNDKNGKFEWDGTMKPVSNDGYILPGTWNEFELSFTAQNGKYMLVGMTNSDVAKGYCYYLDDIEIKKPIPSIVTFDANGGVFDDADKASLNDKGQFVVRTAVGLSVEGPTIDPYRSGKRFMGWATDPEGQNHFPLTTPVDAEVLTLYAMWGDWNEKEYDKIDKDNLTGEKDEIKYKTEIHSEKVWTGNAQIPVLQTGDPIETQEADPVTYTPPVKTEKADPVTDGLPVWLIIVIVVAAVVVVGGGAVLTLLLLKSKKSNDKEVA